MIAFGSSMTSPQLYAQHAGQGVARAAEPGAAVFALQAAGSIARSYNLIMDQAARHEDLEALVLVHQDVEIVDPQLCAKVRRIIAEPQLGAAGCAGVRGLSSIAWWEAAERLDNSRYRYGDAGGGEQSGLAWGAPQSEGEVDSLDGLLLVLPPWTVHNVRFDEGIGQLHGYDFDFSQQLRAAGRRLLVAPFAVLHHHSLDLVTDNEPWVAAHMRAAEKWEGRIPGAAPLPEQDWKRRARRAEAEAAAARLLVASRRLQADAGAELGASRLGEVVHSRSWRLSAPLRKLNERRRRHRDAALSG